MYRENIFQIVMVYSRYHYQGAIHAKFVYCLLKQFLPVDHWCDRHMCWNTNIHKILPLCSFPLGLRSDPYWVHLQAVIVEGASASLRFISLDYLLKMCLEPLDNDCAGCEDLWCWRCNTLLAWLEALAFGSPAGPHANTANSGPDMEKPPSLLWF